MFITKKQGRNRMSLSIITSIALLNSLFSFSVIGQDRLYQNEFSLSDVKLLEGPFKHARDLNIETLLKYNVDRLLAGYRKEAGLQPKDSSYENWDGLDGHVAGHYLSALAMNYAATKNPECKRRMEYMIAEVKSCQEANELNYGDWGKGYVGAVPNSRKIWSNLQKGDLAAFKAAWVPWYNIHKMYAGLRDAWMYTGNEEAKNIFLNFCDWAINITAAFTDAQIQSMLDIEHGGMNEVFADAYQITGKEKYSTAARRFSHRMLLDAMAAEKDNLDNKHANTQVPKAIGFARIGELGDDDTFQKAGKFFWETVTTKRSLAFGGNSRREFFPDVAACYDFINDVEGPESCNSYNMLRLTEDLFRTDPSAKYTDYYERTLYNHILSTQHPVHGGYVYFTPARPRHYRVYSAPNQAMWCCVGSGMENHSKYNQFIYTHQQDSLYVNLFIASELNWKEKGITIRQETHFPYEEKTKLTVTGGASQFTMMIRYPGWVKEGNLKVFVNGKATSFSAGPSSYVAIKRSWKKGDIVQVTLPMHNSIERLPNVPNYIAVMHGPILLAAKTGTEDLKGLIADDSRWGHIAGGEKLPVDKAPIFIEDNIVSVTNKLKPVAGKPLTFRVSQVRMANQDDIVFEPFFKIHDARYVMYWMALSSKQYQAYSLNAQKLQSDNGDGTYTNPVIAADFPDPDVILVGDTYYMVSTTMFVFPGVTILKSKDLVNWEYCSNAVNRFDFSKCYDLDGCHRYSHGQWATSLKYNNGKFYLLFITLDEGGFVCTASSAEGPWEIRKLPKGFYDPGLFFDEDGKIFVAHGYSKISITELNPDLSPKSNDSLVFTGDIRKGLEGMHVYKINGYYYLYGTYGGRDGIQVALRSKNIYGPFEQKVVIRDTTRGINFGIHQGALIKTQTGEWWTILFVDSGPFGRFPSLQPVTWIDGWPMVGVKGKAVITYKKPNVGRSYPVKTFPTSDEFNTQTLGMQWGWNHNPDPARWSLTKRPGYLRLTTSRADSNLRKARNTITQRPFASYNNKPTIAVTKMEIGNMKDGDIAGMAVFQDPYAYIAVRQLKAAKQIIMVNNGETIDSVAMNGNTIYLRTIASNSTEKASFEYSFDNKTFSRLGNELSMKFNLSVFTGNKFCLFNYATKTSGGFVDFDWFRTKFE